MACTGVPGEGAAELKVMSLVAVAGESSQDWGVPAFMCSGAARGQRAWGPGQQGREETDASLQLRESLWTMGKTWDVMPSASRKWRRPHLSHRRIPLASWWRGHRGKGTEHGDRLGQLQMDTQGGLGEGENQCLEGGVSEPC